MIFAARGFAIVFIKGRVDTRRTRSENMNFSLLANSDANPDLAQTFDRKFRSAIRGAGMESRVCRMTR